MKKGFKWALLAGLLLVSAAANAQVKLGYISSSEIFQAMPERDSATTKLEAYAAELQDQLEVMQVELNTKYQDYLKNATTLSDAIRQTREGELRSIQTRIEETQQLFQQDLAQMEQTLLNPVFDRLTAAIQAVAKANGITAVFESSGGGMLYHDPAGMTDMAPLVKRELGIQ